MSDTALATLTTRVQVTMIELPFTEHSLGKVEGQLRAVAHLISYGYATDEYIREQRLEQRGAEEVVNRASGAGFGAHVESMTMTSLKIILGYVPNAIANLLFSIVNAYNDMRRKHAETTTAVLEHKLEQDRIKLLRQHLRTIDPDHPAVAETVERMIKDAALGLRQVASVELLPPA